MKKEFAFLVIALLCIISFSAYYCQQGLSEEKGNQITATVTGKEHVIGYDKGSFALEEKSYRHSYYLIFTDKEVLKIEDSLIFGQFNSSDIYGMMKIGKYYRIKTFGIRSGVLSAYQNIVEVEALD